MPHQRQHLHLVESASEEEGSDIFPDLRQGDSGHSVKVLQALLGVAGYEVLVTGDFDLGTVKEVSKIQLERKLFSPKPGVADSYLWLSLMVTKES